MTTNSVSYRTTAVALVAGLLIGIAGGIGYERRGELMQSWQPAVFGAAVADHRCPRDGRRTGRGGDPAAHPARQRRAGPGDRQPRTRPSWPTPPPTTTIQQMQQINQDLLDNGVSQIKLTKLEWGPVAVSGSSASATTYETWTTTYTDGTSETSRDTNQYSLVQDSGAWKISGDVHPDDASAGDPGAARSVHDPGRARRSQRPRPSSPHPTPAPRTTGPATTPPAAPSPASPAPGPCPRSRPAAPPARLGDLGRHRRGRAAAT